MSQNIEMKPNFVTNVDMNFMENKTLISIVGPTAIGKTTLSLRLAAYFKTEIISADSRQFFEEMTIGTAVPSEKELAIAAHHCIQHISIQDNYSVGDFEKEALEKLENLFQKHDVVIMVGGSGLYVDAVINGLDTFPNVKPEIKSLVKNTFEEQGITALQAQLEKVDPEYYKTVELQNTQRVMRALEVSLSSGKPFSSFRTKKKKKRPFKSLKIGITADRPIIYNRINQRVDIMIQEGLINEARSVYQYKHLNALNTVGYKELFNYFDGEWELDFAISEIKKNTRRFAKRQGTWFRRDTDIIWFDYKYDLEEILNTINQKNC